MSNRHEEDPSLRTYELATASFLVLTGVAAGLRAVAFATVCGALAITWIVLTLRKRREVLHDPTLPRIHVSRRGGRRHVTLTNRVDGELLEVTLDTRCHRHRKGRQS